MVRSAAHEDVGRFNLREALAVGNPCVRIQLEVAYADGTSERIGTDETWKTADGPVRKNSVYLGEVYDARNEIPGWDAPGFDGADWDAASVADAPKGELAAQPIPPIRVTDAIPAKSVHEVNPGVFIFDMGENLAGRARLRCEGPAGTRVTMRYGELLYPDGTLNPMTAVCGQIKNREVPEGSEQPATAWQSDTYILRGEGEEVYAPRFTFHGFRYVEVTGYPGTPALESVTAERLHTDVRPTGEFACGNRLYNTIQELCVRTLRGNMHGVQSDCPHREKFGYGGDLVADSEMALYLFDMAAFYRKVVRDFADAARPNGGFTETAPFVGIADKGFGEGSGPIGWGTVHPLLLTQLYQYYGEKALLEEQYPAAQRWMALLESQAVDGLIDNGIGDHESLVEKDTAVSGTGFYYFNACLMEGLAKILGRTGDAARYAALAESIGGEFNQRLYHPETGAYGLGSQANQAIALHLGLAPEDRIAKTLDALLTDIEDTHQGHLSTGIFGTKYMLQTLSQHGRHDVACRIVDQRDFPGWGHMIENGATTLWEHWEYSDNTFSHNHPMFGTVSEWFFKDVAGIRPEAAACGFDRFILQPRPSEDMAWAKARYNSIRGPIVAQWRTENGRFTLEAEVPPNTIARILLPVDSMASVTESGRPPSDAPGVQPLEDGTGYLAGSGRYCFEAAMP